MNDQLDGIKFSVIMSVYKNEKPNYLDLSLYSVFNQTILPDEVILIIDGPIGEDLQSVVVKYQKSNDSLRVIKLEKNRGLGNALKIAVEESKNDIVFRMDTDDICFHDRFEKQLSMFMEKPCDVLGGQIICFRDDPRVDKLRKGIFRTKNDEILRNVWKSNPFSHSSVMFNKDAVLKAGNYDNLYLHEDYYLWARMLKNGCIFQNIDECILFFRVNPNQSKRRGGKKNYEAEKTVQECLYKSGIISKWEKLKALFIKFNYHIFVPGIIKYYLCKTIRWKKLSDENEKRLEKEWCFLNDYYNRK